MTVPQCHLQTSPGTSLVLPLDSESNQARVGVSCGSDVGFSFSFLHIQMSGVGIASLELHGERCLLFSVFSNARPLLCRYLLLSFPTSRCPSVVSSLCRQRTPASVPTLACQTVSTARRPVVGRRRWMSTATRCTSATILTRRYRPHGAHLPAHTLHDTFPPAR